jgi:formylglycine-generating enzyme required for sulfatase activity
MVYFGLIPVPESPVVVGDCAAVQGTRGSVMCPVPAGTVTLCDHQMDKNCSVVDVKPFLLDRLEVSVEEFAACVEAGKCLAEGFRRVTDSEFCNYQAMGRSNHPMNCVHYRTARNYCSFAGKRLPTRAEWIRAASGDDERTYPWGSEKPDCERANYHDIKGRGCGLNMTRPVDSMALGRSAFGPLNMAGNVQEWTATLSWACDSENKSKEEIQADDEAMRHSEGGSFADDERLLRNTYVTIDEQGAMHIGLGIRCARSESE